MIPITKPLLLMETSYDRATDGNKILGKNLMQQDKSNGLVIVSFSRYR